MNKRIKKKLEKRDKRFHYAQYHEGCKLLKHMMFTIYSDEYSKLMCFELKPTMVSEDGSMFGIKVRKNNLRRSGKYIICKNTDGFTHRMKEIKWMRYHLEHFAKEEYEDKQILDFLDKEYAKREDSINE